MISFRQVHEWAICPSKADVDVAAARDRAKMYREHFRYVRAERQAEFCAPWVLGQELGWRVSSPIDVTVGPLTQVELTPDEDPATAVKAAGLSELWTRETTALAVQRTSWLHLYQFRSTEGNWENTFVPNGADTVEWRLGWAIDGVEKHSLLVLPSPRLPELDVQIGVFTPPMLRRMSRQGCSLPIRPQRPVPIRRGDEIARIVLLHPDSLSVRASETAPAS
ncbi:MAG: hypothetical protein U0Q15_01850 [Kineosporiaceae bacterium]